MNDCGCFFIKTDVGRGALATLATKVVPYVGHSCCIAASYSLCVTDLNDEGEADCRKALYVTSGPGNQSIADFTW